MIFPNQKTKAKIEKIIIIVILILSIIMIILTITGCNSRNSGDLGATPIIKGSNLNEKKGEENMDFEIKKTDEEWKKELTPEEYHIMREKGTERAFTGKYYSHKGDGIYKCAGCGNVLFKSDAKFDSGTGWPSFDKAVDDKGIKLLKDTSYGMTRVEVVCGRCGAHLGHVFDDGHTETGKRFCINSCSLKLDENKEE